jgi:hypothetical protein
MKLNFVRLISTRFYGDIRFALFISIAVRSSDPAYLETQIIFVGVSPNLFIARMVRF